MDNKEIVALFCPWKKGQNFSGSKVTIDRKPKFVGKPRPYKGKTKPQ